LETPHEIAFLLDSHSYPQSSGPWENHLGDASSHRAIFEI
jgi:hypothetical protein